MVPIESCDTIPRPSLKAPDTRGERLENRMSTMFTVERQEQLLSAARAALNNAYAPYSHFRVGAALLTSQGKVYTGCNVENASYGLTMCAERTAIFTAVAAEGGRMEIAAIAVCTDSDQACAPCGACRQVIFQFGPQAVVLFRGGSGQQESLIAHLLPEGFRL
jgi:cytidine deaminase